MKYHVKCNARPPAARRAGGRQLPTGGVALGGGAASPARSCQIWAVDLDLVMGFLNVEKAHDALLIYRPEALKWFAFYGLYGL